MAIYQGFLKFFLWIVVAAGAVMIWLFMPPYTRPWAFPADWWRALGIIAGALFIIGGGTWLVLLGWEKVAPSQHDS